MVIAYLLTLLMLYGFILYVSSGTYSFNIDSELSLATSHKLLLDLRPRFKPQARYLISNTMKYEQKKYFFCDCSQ